MKKCLGSVLIIFCIFCGCKTIKKTEFKEQMQITEPVTMPAEAYSQLRIQANSPVNIKFVDNTSITTDPSAKIEIEVSAVGLGYDKEEINAFMQQALDSYVDRTQVSFSVINDICTIAVDFDVPDTLLQEQSFLKYYYLYPDVTLVLVNVSALEIEAQTKGKINAEVDLAPGAVLKSTENSVTFGALIGASISASSITGDSLDTSTIAATYGIEIDSATDTTITAANSIIAETLERVVLQARDITVETIDNATIVSTGKVSIGTAGGSLAVKTAGGSITVDEFDGDWFNLRQITNRNAYSQAGAITMYIAGDSDLNGIIKTDSGNVALDLLDTLSCSVELAAAAGKVDIDGIDYYQIKNDDNPDDWAQFTLNEGDGALKVETATGNIAVDIADMFFPD